MDSDKPQASTAQGSDDLFPGAPVNVRLPFIGPSANAWAQQKENERRQRMQQQSSHYKEEKENEPLHHKQSNTERFNDAVAIPLVGPTMPASQKPGARSSGLDYDEELALPMPKPRTLSRPTPPPPVPTLMQPPTRRGRKGKDRSVTDPGKPTVPQTVVSMPEITFEEKKVTEKKSKVATLKSKFSLKDMIRESNKDVSKANTHNVKKDTVEQSKSSFESEKSVDSTDEPKLYVPKPKEPGVVPSSAPPTSVPDRFRDSYSSAEEPRIRTVRSTPAAAVESLAEGSRRASVGSTANAETPQSKYVSSQEKIEGIIMGDPSLSPTRTGTYAKSGTPEVIASQSRIVSMQAEVETHRQASGESSSSQVQMFESPMEVLYSPSVYGPSGSGAWEQLQHAHPDTMPMFSPGHRAIEQNGYGALRRASDMSIPPNISTEHRSAIQNPVSSQGRSGNLVISAPGPIPVQYASAPQQSQYPNTPIEDVSLFTGVTSHGGYAPPPPDPEYQSTANLEQQLWTHASTLHHHMNSMTTRLTKVIGDTHNWHMDQVMRNVDNLGDVARILTNRAVGHSQIADETKGLLTEVRGELQALRRESSITDRRLTETVHNIHREIAPLRQKVDALYAEFMSRPSEAKGKQRVQRVPSAEEISARLSNISVASQSTRGRSNTRRRKAKEPSAATEECPSDVPTPTAAFRTPNQAGSAAGDDNDQTVKGDTGKQPQGVSEATTGGPDWKAGSLCSESDHASVSSTLPGPEVASLSEKNTSAGGEKKKNKTPRKKNVFGLGKRQDGEQRKHPKTPKHNGVPEQSLPQVLSEAGTHSPHIPQTPSRASLESSAGSASHISPSLVHPALRNPRQQEIMRQREQQNRQQRPRGPYRRNQQQTQGGFQQHHHHSQLISPSFTPNPAAINAYMSYPPMLSSPTIPPTPGYPPPPPPPMPPRNAPGPHYGPPPSPAWVTGAPAPAMLTPSVSEPWGPSHWYQEAYGGERAGSNQSYQK
ncbi:hypothetical protein DTO169C6_9260 [Paecilomyces variotii]|nr:hypothetical protein DTO169C6_9260 [Paecilomyces variotii]KAJ9351132.1 hypothetical protein DTO027B9_6532 [Paecilomyces variotii]